MAPMLEPPTWSIGIAELGERLDHADVGHPPGPAATEHEADGLAGQVAGDPGDVVVAVAPDVVAVREDVRGRATNPPAPDDWTSPAGPARAAPRRAGRCRVAATGRSRRRCADGSRAVVTSSTRSAWRTARASSAVSRLSTATMRPWRPRRVELARADDVRRRWTRRSASTNQSKSAGRVPPTTSTVSPAEPSAIGSYLKAMRAASILATRVAISGDVAISVVNSSGGSRTSRASRTTTAVRDRPPPTSREPSPNVMPGPASAVITGRPSSSAKKRTRPEMRPYIPSGSSPTREQPRTRRHVQPLHGGRQRVETGVVEMAEHEQPADQVTGIWRRPVDHRLTTDR